MPRRWLGRTYPTDIQDSILNLSQALDDLMANSLEYARLTDLDPSDQIRNLNARLVNEIIIVSDRITDEEARQKLQEIRDPLGTLQISFRKAGLTGGYPAVPTSSILAIIPRFQAEDLVESFDKAQRLYVETVNRYVEARPAAEAALAMPVSGNTAAAMLAEVDRKMNLADRNTADADEDFARLRKLLDESGDAVQIDRPTFDRMRLWIAQVQEMDQAVSRLEGLVGRRPIDSPILAVAEKIPWWVMVLVAAGAITGIAILALSNTKK